MNDHKMTNRFLGVRLGSCSILALLVLGYLFLGGCSDKFMNAEQAYSNNEIRSVHMPTLAIQLEKLSHYQIAFCWRSLERRAFGQGRSDVVIMSGDRKAKQIVSIPTEPPEAIENLGCPSEKEADIRTGPYSMAWRPGTDELWMSSGPSIAISNLAFVDVPVDLVTLTWPMLDHHHEVYFFHPNHP